MFAVVSLAVLVDINNGVCQQWRYVLQYSASHFTIHNSVLKICWLCNSICLMLAISWIFWVLVAVLLVRLTWFAGLVNLIVVWRRDYWGHIVYGCELWDLVNLNVQSTCVDRRQTLRRIWKLPYNCHTAILVSVWFTVQQVIKLCTEMLKFWQYFTEFHVTTCNYFSQMCSVMGHNVDYFCECFRACSLDVIDSSSNGKLWLMRV